MSWRIIDGDCRDALATLPERSVQTCVTSPPYFGLRDYGHDGQIGLEPTPDEFVAALVGVFRGVRRVLRDDGTVWLNLGDSYSGPPVGSFNGGGFKDKSAATGGRDLTGHAQAGAGNKANLPGIKAKDLLGIPWMVAFALRADGWYLRNEIIWAKGKDGQAGMPEAAKDRCSRSHEQVFLLAKRPRYFFDADAIREESAQDEHNQRYAREYEAHSERAPDTGQPGNVNNIGIHSRPGSLGRNKRTVWNVSATPFPGAHFATFPPKLIEPCILAGSRPGDTVLDPFSGAGTTGLVALRHDRSYVGVELNPEYAEMSRWRLRDDAPLLNTGLEEAA